MLEDGLKTDAQVEAELTEMFGPEAEPPPVVEEPPPPPPPKPPKPKDPAKIKHKITATQNIPTETPMPGNTWAWNPASNVWQQVSQADVGLTNGTLWPMDKLVLHTLPKKLPPIPKWTLDNKDPHVVLSWKIEDKKWVNLWK